MESVIQPSDLLPPNYIASQVTLNVITVGVVAVRLWANWSHHKKLFVDDYICIVAPLFMIGFSITSSMLCTALNGNAADITIHYLTTVSNAVIWMATAGMYFAKLPILFLLVRTFGIKKWLRYTCYFLMVFTALGFLAAAIETGINCTSSPSDQLGTPFLIGCMLGTYYTGVSRGSLSIAADLVIITLPLPVISQLKMATRKKFGLATVFLVGSFGIAAGVVSLYYQVNAHHETSDNVVNALLATSIETACILIVGCAAALRVFWTDNLKNSPIFSWISLEGSRGTYNSNSARSKRYQSGADGASNKLKPAAHPYVEFSDIPKTSAVSEASVGASRVHEEV